MGDGDVPMSWNGGGGGDEPGGYGTIRNRARELTREGGIGDLPGDLSGPLPLGLGLGVLVSGPLGDGLEAWTEAGGGPEAVPARRGLVCGLRCCSVFGGLSIR